MSTGTARSFAVRELAPAVLPAQLALQGSPAELGRALRYVAVCGEHAYVAASDGHLHWYTLHAAKPGKVRRLSDAGRIVAPGKEYLCIIDRQGSRARVHLCYIAARWRMVRYV